MFHEITFKEIEARVRCEVARIFNDNPPCKGQCVNPVTGFRFFGGYDAVEPQIMAAHAALMARAVVPLPPDAPVLPISRDEIDELKYKGNPFLHVVGCFGESLYLNEFDFLHHPIFHDYVCGLMAFEGTPEFVRDSEHMRRRFPPRPLAGIKRGLNWEPSQRRQFALP